MQRELYELKLNKLAPTTPAAFGIMSAQHMVEHLTLTVKLSSGRIKIPEFEPSEKQISQKEMLLNTPIEFPKGINAPGLEGVLMPLKYDSFSESIDQLLNSIDFFNAFFSTNPTSKTMHPRFGRLNHMEWEKFHAKHFQHHFSQFGIW
jgi:hypothetical protein